MKGAQQATLIGDHKQLPAVVTVRLACSDATGESRLTSFRLTQSQEAKDERLHLSLFERLLTSQSAPFLSFVTRAHLTTVACRDQVDAARHAVPHASVHLVLPEPVLLLWRAARRRFGLDPSSAP